MDPRAPLPAGEPLLLTQMASAAPFRAAAIEALGPIRGGRQHRKPLRSPKQRFPVAEAIDEEQIRGLAAETVAAVPATAAPPAAPAAVTTFAGGSDNNTTIPPDTAGAVGPNHVFNPLNNNVSIFDRTGTLLSVVSLDAFWSTLGIQGNTFDPRVVFDPHGQRFIFATMANAESPTSSLLVAVSDTADPTQGWRANAIQVDAAAQGPVWLDFPSVGFTADKITIQVNLFTLANNDFAGSTIYAFDKASLYNPPHQALVQRFNLVNQGATHVPVVTHDQGFGDQLLIARWATNVQGQGSLVVYGLAGNVATGQALLRRIGFLVTGQTWEPFPPGDLGRQLGVSRRVDVGDDRILAASLRNGKLYCCQAVMLPTNTPSRSAIQWWEIDTANWNVDFVGRIDDPAGDICYAFPSLAVNSQGDLLIGHAEFSAAIHPSASFTMRESGGNLNGPQIFAAGQNSYNKTFGGSTNRWGDYSYVQVDPVNDTDFWTVQEVASPTRNVWATTWANIVP